jgi:hypothetical protein
MKKTMKHFLVRFRYSNDNATIVESVVSFGENERLAILNIKEDYYSYEMESLGFECDIEAIEIDKLEATILAKYL